MLREIKWRVHRYTIGVEEINIDISSKQLFDNLLKKSINETIEQDYIEIYKYCVEKKLFEEFFLYFNSNTTIELFKKFNNEFFLEIYVYMASLITDYDKSEELLSGLNLRNIKSMNLKYNLSIAFTHLKKYKQALEIIDNYTSTKFMFQKAFLFQELGDLEKAYSICKTLKYQPLENFQKVILDFRFLELLYLKNCKLELKKLIEQVKDFPQLSVKDFNIRYLYLYKYYSYLNDPLTAFNCLIKAASFYAEGDLNCKAKNDAIEILFKEMNSFAHKSFEQNLPNKKYRVLKAEYEKELESGRSKYKFI